MLTKNGDRVTTNGDNHSPQMGSSFTTKGDRLTTNWNPQTEPEPFPSPFALSLSKGRGGL